MTSVAIVALRRVLSLRSSVIYADNGDGRCVLPSGSYRTYRSCWQLFVQYNSLKHPTVHRSAMSGLLLMPHCCLSLCRKFETSEDLKLHMDEITADLEPTLPWEGRMKALDRLDCLIGDCSAHTQFPNFVDLLESTQLLTALGQQTGKAIAVINFVVLNECFIGRHAGAVFKQQAQCSGTQLLIHDDVER